MYAISGRRLICTKTLAHYLQQLSAEQYRLNTPAKAARGASRRGPCVKVPQCLCTFVNHLKDPKLFGEILD